jgi:nucleoside-diphosphate-sugar epimerase
VSAGGATEWRADGAAGVLARVVVTGASGFLGQALVAVLRSRGASVRALVRPATLARADRSVKALRALDADLVGADVLDRDAVARAVADATCVFHLAGQLLVPGIPDADYEALHVEGTRHVLEACTQAHCTVVHCSTTGVLGPTDDGPADEDAPLAPSNVYERTKAAGERLVLAHAAESGLSLAVARPALVYGPGDLHLLGWFRAIARGWYRVVGSGESLLHPVYIDDLSEGLVRCATHAPASPRVYHLVGPTPVAIGDLAAAIAAAVGRRLPRTRIPRAAAWSVARVLEAVPGVSPAQLPLTRSRITFMTQSRAYRGERAARELGFVPAVDLATGLRRTVEWYRREGLL